MNIIQKLRDVFENEGTELQDHIIPFLDLAEGLSEDTFSSEFVVAVNAELARLNEWVDSEWVKIDHPAGTRTIETKAWSEWRHESEV